MNCFPSIPCCLIYTNIFSNFKQKSGLTDFNISFSIYKVVDIFDSEDEDDNIFSDSRPTKNILAFSLERSLVLYEEVFSKAGVWDQFVPTCLEVLQQSQNKNTVRKLLEEYKDKNPLNPNTHRYSSCTKKQEEVTPKQCNIILFTTMIFNKD